MKYQITHLTQYRYQYDIANCYNHGCLVPRSLPYQKVDSARIDVLPLPSSLYTRRDFFGNQHNFFHVNAVHRHLEVKTTSRVEVIPRDVHSAVAGSMPWEEARRALQRATDEQSLQARLLCTGTRMTPVAPVYGDYARALFEPGLPILEGARRLCHRIFSEFSYDPGFTTITTPVDEVLRQKRGVCQDFAQLAISALRSLGLPARYVSGYLETLPPPGQPRLVGADASHAWFSVFAPGEGWVDFDPTNDLMPSERHITIAYGRDYGDVVPLKGLMNGGGHHELIVEVDVMPLEAAGP